MIQKISQQGFSPFSSMMGTPPKTPALATGDGTVDTLEGNRTKWKHIKLNIRSHCVLEEERLLKTEGLLLCLIPKPGTRSTKLLVLS